MDSSDLQEQPVQEGGETQAELRALRERLAFRQSDQEHRTAVLGQRLVEVTRERDDLVLGCKVLRDKLTRHIPPAVNTRRDSVPVSRRPAAPGSRLHGLRVAAITDEFTHSALAPSCTVEQVNILGWREQLERFKPELLFIESAWQGNGGQWANKVHHPSREFLDLVAWCQSKNVPTVFWNKEDPVHFETFINTAKRFDYVFTTDLDCIGRYKTLLGHECVYLMPFFCQPRLHNPVEVYDRQPGFCFAGAYYVRYPERQKDFDVIIDTVRDLAPVEIFDRNYGKDDPSYMFPDRYQGLIRGMLPYREIDRAYKGYEFGINLNSVKQSQTMFARRVFDLMLSNTQVVSNYSRGLRLMFGDLVVATDSADELRRRLAPIVGSDPEASTLRRYRNLLALRKVMLEHTADNRMAYVLSKISGEPVAPPQPEVIVVTTVGSDADLAWVLAAYKSQSWARKHLVLVLADQYLPTAPLPQGPDIETYTRQDAETIEPHERWPDCALAFFCVGDAYGEHYLTDAALALLYADAEVVGKSAHYQGEADGSLTLQGDGSQYRATSSLLLRRSMARASATQGTLLWDWAGAIPVRRISGEACLAIDEFNYVANAPEPTLGQAAQPAAIRSGLAIEYLYRVAESVTAQNTSIDVKGGFDANSMFQLFQRAGATGAVRVKMSGPVLQLESTLGEAEHKYIYANRQIELSELHPVAGTISYHLVAMPGLRLDVVLIFLAESGERLGQAISTVGKNHECAVPDGTANVRLGLRILGPGTARVYGLATDEVPPVGPTPPQLAQADSLVLTNIYPSAEHLYRNAFVHRRVLGYHALGTHPDLFVIKSRGGARGYNFQGVDVTQGDADALKAQLSAASYKTICVHFLSPEMWEAIRSQLPTTRIIIWLHGSDVQAWHRRAFNYATEEEVDAARRKSEARISFWRQVFSYKHPNMSFVFVSKYLADTTMEDVGVRLDESRYHIIHNFIDSDVFAYEEKPAQQRMRVLSIRPFTSLTYANDLSVRAILSLRDEEFFNDMEFRIIGDGALFDETLAPLKGLPNVTIERGFLEQQAISKLHKEFGVFLCPSRMDTQGVSRDEAMSSGLVPITNRVGAIPEFVDDSCARLAGPDDWKHLAEELRELARDPQLFRRRSRAAALRVRSLSGASETIQREVEIIRATSAWLT